MKSAPDRRTSKVLACSWDYQCEQVRAFIPSIYAAHNKVSSKIVKLVNLGNSDLFNNNLRIQLFINPERLKASERVTWMIDVNMQEYFSHYIMHTRFTEMTNSTKLVEFDPCSLSWNYLLLGEMIAGWICKTGCPPKQFKPSGLVQPTVRAPDLMGRLKSILKQSGLQPFNSLSVSSQPVFRFEGVRLATLNIHVPSDVLSFDIVDFLSVDITMSCESFSFDNWQQHHGDAVWSYTRRYCMVSR